jgi:hypothetical protein
LANRIQPYNLQLANVTGGKEKKTMSEKNKKTKRNWGTASI